MKKIFVSINCIAKTLLCVLLFTSSVLSQSKKKQIEILNNKVDSLNSVLTLERNNNKQMEIEFKDQISVLQNQLKNANQEFQNKSMKIHSLENEVIEKEKLIYGLTNQVNESEKKLAQLLLNSKIELIGAPSFSISNSQLISIVDSKMIDPCPLTNIYGDQGPEICKKNVTITYFKMGDIIRFFACVGYSFEGAHFEGGQNGFVLAEYKNSKWSLIDFLQFSKAECWGNSLEIKNQYILGKKSFGYYSLSCMLAQGVNDCTSYIIGFVGEKIAVLLDENSSLDNLGEGIKPVINWKFDYQPIQSDNQFYTIERKLLEFDKFIESKTLKYNSQLMKFE